MAKQFFSSMSHTINWQINEIKEKIDDLGELSLDLVTFGHENDFQEKKSVIFRIKNLPKMLLYYR